MKQKIDIKILTGFLTVCGRFFCQKIHWLKILTDQICLIYFHQLSTFWQLFNILTRVWVPVKILIKNLVLRWTFSQNQSSATAASGSNIFNTMILIKILMERVWVIWRQKSYIKIVRPFFASKYWLFFWSCMGPFRLNPSSLPSKLGNTY